ncbi:MAG: ROK family protein [Prevotella sp.]|nr:ROK family protein [Prevotella sp.]
MKEMRIKTKVIGVDISLDVTTCAVVDLRGNILAKDTFPTAEYENVNNYITVLCECINKLAEAFGGHEGIRSVGISAPSSNVKTGCIENAANLPWKGVIPLAAILRDRLGMAVAVANDCHVVALGEQAFGTAHGMQDFVVITFKRGGVGSCFFVNGRPHLGARGFAGEVGHTCVVPGGRQCGCGRQGCLERYVSIRGIVDTAKELMAETDQPSLMRNIRDLTANSITLCCEQGDELAREVYRRTGRLLGTSVAHYASILNPEAVILTGDIAHAAPWFMDAAEAALDEHVFHNLKGKVRLLVSILDEAEAELLGASALAWSVKEYSLFK